MGLFDSNKKQTTTQTQNTNQSTSGAFNNTSTSRTEVPDWLLNPAKQLGGGLTDLIGRAGDFVPQLNDNLRSAFDRVGGLSTSPLVGQGAELVGQGAGMNPRMVATDYRIDPGSVRGESLLDGLDNYFNPYEERVIDTTLADFDENSGRVRASQAAQAARTGAFRGSRYGIREAETEGQLARGRANTDATLRSAGFDRATSLSSQDAARRQSAAEANAARSLAAQTTAAQLKQGAQTTNAGLSESALGRKLQAGGLLAELGFRGGAEDRANLGLLSDIGGREFALDTAIKSAPLEVQRQLTGLLAGLNPALFSDKTTTSAGTTSGTTVGTSSGTGTTTQNGSFGSFFGDLLLALAASGGNAAASGEGG